MANLDYRTVLRITKLLIDNDGIDAAKDVLEIAIEDISDLYKGVDDE